ncbi:MAG: Hpt domain-containing protein [Spirochaetia bacterium]
MAKDISQKDSALSMLTQAEEYLGLQGHDKETVDEMFRMLEERTPELNGAIKKAVDEKEPEKLRKAVHSLKGILSTLGMDKAAGHALEVEKAVHAEEIDRAEELSLSLVEKMNTFLEVLKKRSGEDE